MSKEAELELFRMKLAREFDESNFEWAYTAQIVLVSMETGANIDEILEWTPMRYNVVLKTIEEKYKDANKDDGDFVKTLG
jgi:hypothetical protein